MVIHIGQQTITYLADILAIYLPLLCIVADEQVRIQFTYGRVAANDNIDQSIVFRLELPNAL